MRVRAYCNLETGGCVVPTFVRSCPLATKLLQCRDCPLCAISDRRDAAKCYSMSGNSAHIHGMASVIN